MSERIFLAGATGAIGTALVPLLARAGYTVYGGTRRAERAAALEAAGATAVVVDVFDAAALSAALVRIGPAVVIHQLTDLPPGLDPARMGDAALRNARIRDEGTRNLAAAARAAGCARFVAQSIAWAYAPGTKPFTEDQPLDLDAEGNRRISVRGIAALEKWALDSFPLAAPVPSGPSPVHVEAAAWAALLATRRASGGIFNVVEDKDDVSNEKARRVLGWTPELRLTDAGPR